MSAGVWHEGHIMGGYQNPKCPSCQREEQQRIAFQARDICDLRSRWRTTDHAGSWPVGPMWCHTHDLPASHFGKTR